MRPFDRLGGHGRNAVALAAGATWPLAFAPFGLWPVSLVALSVLFCLLDGLRPGAAARVAFAFGLGMFGAGVWWVYVSINYFGGLHWSLAGSLTASMIFVLALFIAGFGWLAGRVLQDSGPVRWLVGLPAAWVLVEWLRSWVLSGFPWLSIGYAFSDTWLAGYAPIGGVLLVSTAVAVSGGAVVVVWARPRSRAAVVAAVVVTAVWAGGGALGTVDWSAPTQDTLDVALVQGNVAQDEKWLPAELRPTIRLYHELTADHWDADLIVWPEAALPALRHQLEPYLDELAATSARNDAAVMMGVLVWEPERDEYFNSVLSLDSGDLYHKRHLVPFGEFFPVPSRVREWLRLMNLPYSDFTRGPRDPTPLRAAGQTISGSICYEVAYASSMIRGVRGSTLLVNVSNDGWFGNTIAPHQHLQIARMRAREAGRWMLRATNTGVTAVIDDRGRIVAHLPQFEAAVLRTQVQPRTGATPYAYAANWPPVILLLLMLGLAARLRYA